MSITDDLLTLLMGKVNGEGGGDKPLTPLTNPALAENILAGKEAYNDQKEVLTGSLTVADLLAALTNPAAVGDLLAGKEAYNDQGVKLIGSLTVADLLAALNTPASAGDIAAGKEAYDDQGLRITGTAVAGNPEAQSNDVNYYDYDGTIRYSYSAEDFLALADHPANPTHRGLVAQGWNWPLAEAKSYVSKYGMLNVGQMYITDDGATRITFRLSEQHKGVEIHLRSDNTPQAHLSVDWGDDSFDEVIVTQSQVATTISHTYAVAGTYVASLFISEELDLGKELILGGYTTGSAQQNHVTSNPAFGSFSLSSDSAQNASKVIAVSFGRGIVMGIGAFFATCALKYVTLPINGASARPYYAFGSAKGSFHVTIPYREDSTINISGMFQACNGLRSVSLPYSGKVSASATHNTNVYQFNENNLLTRLTLPAGLTKRDINNLTNLMILVSPDATAATEVGTSSKMLTYLCIPSCAGMPNIGGTPIKRFVMQEGPVVLSTTFTNCVELSYLEIASTVTTIRYSALSGLTSLRELHFRGATPPTINASTDLNNLPTSCTIYVPRGSLEAYTTATNYPSSATHTYVEED